jgi:hypothetical protein
MLDQSDPHYTIITKHIADGNLIPFLGAGANLCGRPLNTAWQQGSEYLPSGGELAALLASGYGFPTREIKLHCPSCHSEVKVSCPKCQMEVRALDEAQDLLRVAQYVANASGLGQLYEDLHQVFSANCPPTALHRFLATLPANLASKGHARPELLIVTTNYDDLMERAFQEAGQPFDVVTYVAQGEHQGRFVHWPSTGDPKLIEEPNKYTGLCLEERPVILKIHGAVSRLDRKNDSYVIREDDYIAYLARTTDLANVLPSVLLGKLKESHLLFLGYSLSDWNLRVILYRIWSEQAFDYKSWAIQVNPQSIDQQFWSKRNVEILDVHLEAYVAELQARIASLQPLPILQAVASGAGATGQEQAHVSYGP